MLVDMLLKLKQVTDIVAMRRSAIYAMMRKGRFPRPIRIGERAVAWKRSEVEAWLASRPRGGTLSGDTRI